MMKKTYLRHIFLRFTVLLMALPMFVACVKDQEVESSPKCAILSFSVSNITSSVTTKKYDSNGNATDTVVRRVVSGSDIHFNIDQVNGRIYTVDSLPKWIDLTRVVPVFSSYGNVFGKVVENDETYYGIASGSDSINFSKTVELLCVSTDGLSSKTYKVDMYRHTSDMDTLEWKSVTSDLKISGLNKAFSIEGKVFAFAKNAVGENVVTCTDNDPAAWSAPVVIPVDCGSIVVFRGAFYGLGADGYIYKSAPAQLATEWEKVSDISVERLLAADDYYIYLYDGMAIIGSADLSTWTEQGSADLDMLPETAINSCNYVSRTNSNMQTVVMTGTTSKNTENGVSWYKVSSTDSNTNQKWSYIRVTADNPYGLPLLGNLSVTRYEGALYAIGVEEEGYQTLYRSDDNGITWHVQAEKYLIPADLDAANGAASIVAVGEEMWIIQESGQIWRGSIR
ncbi:MAG: hypothetical protein J1F40_09655 [Prevotellaceae bacterium]|nr:hypothetical protein [Prevotellaceae bacterium]